MELQRVVLALLRSARLLAVAALAAFLVAASVSALRPDVYEAQALVDVAALLDDDTAFSNAERADRTVANELVLAQGGNVAELASDRLGGVDPDGLRADVSIDQLTGTDNISFTATARQPGAAAETATAYAESYVTARLDKRRATVEVEAEGLAQERADLQRQIAAVAPQDEATDQALRQLYSQVVAREVELRTSARPDSDLGRALLPAASPDQPSGVSPILWGALAAVLTLALGALAIASRGRRRDAIEFPSDLQDLGLPVLAAARPPRRFWDARVDEAGDGGLLDEVVLGLTLPKDVPAVVAVLAVDGDGHGTFARALGDRLRDWGVQVDAADLSPGASRRPTSTGQSTTLLDATDQTSDAWRMRSAEVADVVLLLVVRGVTRRADLSRTLEKLERVSSSPPLGVLLEADQPGQQDGSSGRTLTKRTTRVKRTPMEIEPRPGAA
jgi:capsular polysaccharide biosynthesis protein